MLITLNQIRKEISPKCYIDLQLSFDFLFLFYSLNVFPLKPLIKLVAFGYNISGYFYAIQNLLVGGISSAYQHFPQVKCNLFSIVLNYGRCN